ncbi:2,5-diketo-D-gluconic acid reductase A [Colletotrichum trifolii]|uniref:2,5-diketo-D-gluconic acid reductase A n=1 Tax=Colletotrichum trifolii TaxID=5466 RepID=A0A4R8R0U4_COLTR|nr:2,5-diketo-D-gluconic acid reductase A [Colletotrichum trifolii]
MAATTGGRRAKTAHVNMMTDTIINNVPAEVLRVIMRSLLASHPEITATFEDETRRYIQDVALPRDRSSCASSDVTTLKKTQKTIRCMLGCGLSSQSIGLMANLAVQGVGLLLEHPGDLDDGFLASIDGDIVQLVTAMEKKLLAAGRSELDGEDGKNIRGLRQQLMDCHERTQEKDLDYPYGRALTAASLLLGAPISQFDDVSDSLQQAIQVTPAKLDEVFQINGRTLPRIFSGLWQMSSPSWGSAPTSKIIAQFTKYVSAGMMAFDMADHYGDAEIVFGRFNCAYAPKGETFAATKYCVFNPKKVTREAIAANVSERCRRLQSNKIDLLQFHWQFYDDPQYLDALRFLAEDERVGTLGLCNFDTKHMDNVISNGIKVHSNQVQFSLIDSRPVVRMATCGGFLAEKWLGQVEPDLYAETITPSQRKYHAMIRSWGGWTLFQELLQVLKDIAAKHNVSVSTVAIRWVLDFAYVGAVIVGARMGISEHADENLASLGWSLDEGDRDSIEEVLKRSKRLEMFEDMGDCGGEYR